MISVITPVFNAEGFLVKNIESVLSQKEVSEHILIDDGSTDNSWSIISKYAATDNRIIALRHPDKKNHGRSKTRNIGILKASNKLIAFLDADDFYLKNRFQNDVKILKNEDIDGVYNAIGIHFYDSYEGKKNIRARLTTIRTKILPENLFEKMTPIGNEGWFSGDGFTVKKKPLLEVGLFNEKLVVAEDTELWIKLAMKYKLVGGDIHTPVAKRGVHGANVFYDRMFYKKPKVLMYQSLIIWSLKNKIERKRVNIIIIKFINYLSKYASFNFLIFFKYWASTIILNYNLKYSKKYIKGIFSYLKGILKKTYLKVKS